MCGLPKDRGPERDFVVRWAFDMEYGGCSRFWWGGEVRLTARHVTLVVFNHSVTKTSYLHALQGGNRNNFEAKEECDDTCVHPEGKQVSQRIHLLLRSSFDTQSPAPAIGL